MIGELKIPLIDERVYDTIKIKSPRMEINFVFEQEESVISGFLGLSEYFHSIVLKKKEKFYIPVDEILFVMESK